MTDSILQRILALAPDQFENLVYECARARGVKNIVWRTPGADGGRDIEGLTVDTDVSGATDTKKWYIECKRYSSTLDWPTVRVKIAYAESNDADFLLVATTTNPTPQCENEISKWNALKRRPQVRFWRGYDLPNIVRGVPHIATMFGLAPDPREANASLIPLAQVATRAAQACYARNYFNPTDTSSIETVAAVSELFSVRLNDLKDFNRPAAGPTVRGQQLFDWLDVRGDLSSWEDTSLRAVVSFLRYEYHAQNGILTCDNNDLILSLENVRKDAAEGLPHDRSIVEFWACIKVSRSEASGSWLLEKLPYVR